MRNILKKIFIILLTPLCFAGCNNNNSEANSFISNSSEDTSSKIEDSSIEEKPTIQNALVIYFSATNNTKRVADTIANHISAPIFELEPVEPYTQEDLNWTNSNSRVVREHEDSNRHVELKTVEFAGFDDANYIFLGAPVWWQELSWVVDDFVKLNDFSGKTIIPFATSASSSFTTSNLQEFTENATWLAPQRFSSSVNENTVISWLDGLDLSL